MNELREAWLAKLESGRYHQGFHVLRQGDYFCAMGLMAEVAVEAGIIGEPTKAGELWRYDPPECGISILSRRVIEAFGLSAEGEIELTRMNDGLQLPFSEIARRVRTGEVRIWL